MISKEDTIHVAKLARLELSEEEVDKFSRQLGDILGYVEQMNEIDTTNVKPMAHPFDVVNVMREDEVYYDNTKEEQINALLRMDRMFSPAENDPTSPRLSSLSSQGFNFAALAQRDVNHDGIISQDELDSVGESVMHEYIYINQAGNASECADPTKSARYDMWGTTTINGEKVYAIYGSSELALTESEFKKLGEYYAKNGAGADIKDAISALGIKGETKTINGQECFVFTGASGVESVVRNGNGLGLSSHLWYTYRAIVALMDKDNVINKTTATEYKNNAYEFFNQNSNDSSIQALRNLGII